MTGDCIENDEANYFAYQQRPFRIKVGGHHGCMKVARHRQYPWLPSPKADLVGRGHGARRGQAHNLAHFFSFICSGSSQNRL